ncbi:MAG: hypothetical protein ACRETF_05730 [Nevskiaceae bacterium]
MRVPTSWLFAAAAAIPCAALLVFCGIGVHEWWLISTRQIAVIPAVTPGTTSAPEVPASSLLPLIFVSAGLAAAFGYAWLRGSRRTLAGAYLALALVIALAVIRKAL